MAWQLEISMSKASRHPKIKKVPGHWSSRGQRLTKRWEKLRWFQDCRRLRKHGFRSWVS
jgi:hypothetical protein